MATLITPHMIAAESLIVLENNMVLAGLVHRDFSKEFKKVGSTVSIRKPATLTSGTVSGTVNTQTLTESSVDVVLDTHLDITVEITSQELTLSMKDFSEQLIQPAMRGHAQAIDRQLADKYTEIGGHYEVSSTPAVGDVAGLEAVMDAQKVPLMDRRLVLHPMTKSGYMSLDAFLNADKRGDGGQALRKAELGQVLGFDTYMDQNIQTHTITCADSTGAIDATVAAAATALAIDGITASAVIPVGSNIKVTGYDEWFVSNTAATASTGGTVTVGVAPAVTGPFANNSVVTIMPSGRANMAFHKNAIALVTAPLEAPLGGAQASVMNFRNISARVVYGYEQRTKKNLISLDILLGVKVLDQLLAARFNDTR